MTGENADRIARLAQQWAALGKHRDAAAAAEQAREAEMKVVVREGAALTLAAPEYVRNGRSQSRTYKPNGTRECLRRQRQMARIAERKT